MGWAHCASAHSPSMPMTCAPTGTTSPASPAVAAAHPADTFQRRLRRAAPRGRRRPDRLVACGGARPHLGPVLFAEPRVLAVSVDHEVLLLPARRAEGGLGDGSVSGWRPKGVVTSAEGWPWSGPIARNEPGHCGRARGSRVLRETSPSPTICWPLRLRRRQAGGIASPLRMPRRSARGRSRPAWGVGRGADGRCLLSCDSEP